MARYFRLRNKLWIAPCSLLSEAPRIMGTPRLLQQQVNIEADRLTVAKERFHNGRATTHHRIEDRLAGIGQPFDEYSRKLRRELGGKRMNAVAGIIARGLMKV